MQIDIINLSFKESLFDSILNTQLLMPGNGLHASNLCFNTRNKQSLLE